MKKAMSAAMGKMATAKTPQTPAKTGVKKAHPGFAAVQQKIQNEGYSKEAAGAILAAKTRAASGAAKAANPRLKRVKG